VKSKEAAKTKPNRLINETSTYLLQHAYNPVDWYPWGEEAIKRAVEEDKPILLSIGYAACHWCHVMEHESFEDESTARLMNENFVNIKVDREERTDLDEIYMKAVQMMTGHGGWPMTVFLTPDLKPFYGGTYFPPQDRHGLPSFKRLLNGIMDAWKNQKEQVTESSQEITEHLKQMDKLASAEGQTPLEKQIIVDAVDKLLRIFDAQWGGFGNAPKFPHTFSLSLALACTRSGALVEDSVKEECQQLFSITMDRMALGGIHDQIGGGFARYSVDRQWLVPHFEKMLYDNALLCQAYLDGFAATKRDYWARVARGILEFVLRELTTEDGAFYSSLDADSEGEEGKFYVFTAQEVEEILGKTDAQWLNKLMGVSANGNFEHGTNILHLVASPEQLAKENNMSVDALWNKLTPLNESLLAHRNKRVRPGRDEKVLTSWNSLMISAFVGGYKVLQEEKYLDAARRAAEFILLHLVRDGRLLRTWGQGKAKLNAYLDDYAYFVQALLDLASVDFDQKWLALAMQYNAIMLKHFDDGEGGFFYTSDDHETLVTRPKSHYDGSIPSGTSVAVFNLLKLAKITDNKKFESQAEKLMEQYARFAAKVPDQFSNIICAMDFHLRGGQEMALIADAQKDKESWQKLLFAMHGVYLPHKVVALGTPDAQDASPLLSQRSMVEGKPTVYICKNYTCDRPVTDSTVLQERLQELAR
jgi:uncharacterized protein YyaL (SSP411 family)